MAESKDNLGTWKTLDSGRRVWQLTYSFGPATANTMAVKLDDGSFLVVSPATNISQNAMDELGMEGPVSALLAPNSFHHLGQAAWRKQFPNAVSYAPPASIARLQKQSKLEYKPLAELNAKLGPHVKVIEAAGMKAPDLLVKAKTDDGNVWFGGDLISNQGPEDGSALVRFLFKVLGGGPGYRFNKPIALLYLKDREAWKADVRARMGDGKLHAVVPAHGAVATGETVARTQEILK